ncbi:MAG: Dabb family protein [Xanthomonadaceae bacterium]|nr:Dabb family protein [Xanthomonadaceae bacterium]
MLKHLIFLKFRPEVTNVEINAIEKGLAALPAVIPEITSFEFGRDTIHSDRSFDFALISTFTDPEALKRYQVHPAHQEVLVLVKAACHQIAAVDFQV